MSKLIDTWNGRSLPDRVITIKAYLRELEDLWYDRGEMTQMKVMRFFANMANMYTEVDDLSHQVTKNMPAILDSIKK